MKSQVVVDQKSKQIICTSFSEGKKHDFKLFKESKTNMHKDILSLQDTGFIGIEKIHSTSILPKKRSKKKPLSKKDKKQNVEISSDEY